MNKITNYCKNHSILFGGMFFTIVSIVLNLVSILLFNMVHVYDIVHIFPVGILLAILPSEPNTQLALLPIALIVDGLVGLLVGKLFSKLTNRINNYVLGIVITFFVYYFVICFQWIPII